MPPKSNIQTRLVEYHRSNGLDAEWLTIELSGEDVNIKMVNAIRRVVMKDIPMYGFPKELIKITTNTSAAFNNSFMIDRLSVVPVCGITPEISFLEPLYQNPSMIGNPSRLKDPSEKLVVYALDVHNQTNDFLNVTTNDLTILINNEPIANPYSSTYPHLLIKLRPGDKFACTMQAILGLGEHKPWRGCFNAFHEELAPNVFSLTIEPNYQCHGKLALMRACDFLIRALGNLQYQLANEYEQNQWEMIATENIENKLVKITLHGEDHTVGELLNYELQSQSHVIFCGVIKPNFTVKAMELKIITDFHTPDELLALMDQCLRTIKQHLAHLRENISKLSLPITSFET